jgi:hypothetical protein
VLAPAGLLATTIGFVGAIGVLDSNDIGGASPWRSVLLSVLVSLIGFAGSGPVHPAAAGKSPQWLTGHPPIAGCAAMPGIVRVRLPWLHRRQA